MVDNGLGGRISAAIKKSGRSQASVAEAMGYSPQAVTKWKKGIIGKDALQALARELGMDLMDILYEHTPNKGPSILRVSPQASALIATIQQMDVGGELSPAQSRLLTELLESFRAKARKENATGPAEQNLEDDFHNQ